MGKKIGIVIAIIILAGGAILIFTKVLGKTSPDKQKKYLTDNLGKSPSDKAAMDKFTSAANSQELDTAYTYVKDYVIGGKKGVPADLQKKVDDLTTKFGIFG